MANGIVLNIDTTKSEFQNPMVQLRQGDGNYQSLSVTVTSNGEPFDLTGWTITFMGTTAGGFKIIDAASVVTDAVQGEFTYTPTKAWGQDEGEFKNAYFKFTKADETASGASFRVNVLDAVDLTDEEAKDYISVVDVMIDQVKTDMDTKLAETKQTLADTQSQANTVQTNVNDLNTNVNELKAQNNNIKTSDNTWTGTNTFNKKIIAPAGVQGPIDNTELINTPAFQSLKTQVDNSANVYVKDTRLASGITDFNLVIGKTWSGKWYKAGGHWSNEPTGASNYLQFEYTPADNDTSGILEIRDWTTNRHFIRTVSSKTWSNWVEIANDAKVVHNTGTETVAGDKTFTGNTNLSGQTTLKTGNYGLRVTTTGIQKTSDGGTTWVNI